MHLALLFAASRFARPILLGLVLLHLTAEVSRAMIWVWMPPERYVQESTLIAIGTVGTMHETVSPEGVMVRSAVVKIEQLLSWRLGADLPAPAEIVLYEVDPNNGAVAGGALLGSHQEGRCFLFLQMRGMGKFSPYDRLSVQRLEKETLWWPTDQLRTEEVPVQRVIAEIKALLK